MSIRYLGSNILNKFSIILMSIALLSSIFQFYCCRIEKSYISIVLIIELIAILISLFYVNKVINFKLSKIIIFILLGIIIFEVISLFWSIDIKLGLKQISIFLSFLALFILSLVVTLDRKELVEKLFSIYFYFLLIFLIAIIIFRLYPDLEISFLHSNFAKLFINPNILDGLFTINRNNILDPSKSGVFFVNANVASAFIGINFFIIFGFYLKDKSSLFLKLLLILNIISLVFTGSKTAIIMLPFILFILFILSDFKSIFLKWMSISILLFILSIFLIHKHNNYLYYTKYGTTLNKIEYIDTIESKKRYNLNTLMIRARIWNYSLNRFLQKPFKGEGFGGWFKYYKNYARTNDLNPGYPPHNTIIYLWSQSGIAVVILAIIFIYVIIRFSINLIKSSNIDLNFLGISLFGAYSWVFLHGMVTNFGLVGDEHILILLSVILGYAYALSISPSRELV